MMATWPTLSRAMRTQCLRVDIALAAQWVAARSKADEGVLVVAIESQSPLKAGTQRRPWLPTGTTQTHQVTEDRLAEWQKLRHLAQQKVAHADSQTIMNAIRTWKELAHCQEDRGLEVVEDFATFVQEGADGPVMAIASLKWLSKAA